MFLIKAHHFFCIFLPGFSVLATSSLMSPIFYFERCLDSNPESCRRRQARYQLSHPSPIKGNSISIGLQHYIKQYAVHRSIASPKSYVNGIPCSIPDFSNWLGMSKVEAEWRRAGAYWPVVGRIAELAHLCVPGQVKLFTPLLLFSSSPSSSLTIHFPRSSFDYSLPYLF
jgi:hypothetical protein